MLKVRAGNPMYEWDILILPDGLEKRSKYTRIGEEFLR
jgi:hypothetical protein